jgi:hypothetical protein
MWTKAPAVSRRRPGLKSPAPHWLSTESGGTSSGTGCWFWGRPGGDPAVWAGESDQGGLKLPNETWGRIALTEVVVHGWDLAKATGLPYELPAETVRACYEHVAGFLAQPPVPELWAAPIEVPAEAPLMDRLVGITGRQP